ncbi:hypothetical protein Q7F20_08820 [Curtobacterium sp. A7_M15]|uniref:hypothetical protein n=1 Tax=Curtobacterium sp. A7_M15 TaxID=3065241 RepID=UPI002737FFF5|nr:hypothetical protein [Curtobacterium sp. A7_M15]MDP4333471.1 hypothetical protein [Curtobacterium sp. A7_M15]
MLRRVQERVRRMPAVARLLALAALLLVAAAAHTGVRTGITDCGPGTYGPPCGANVLWVPLVVGGVLLAVFTGSPDHLWPLPAIWLVATLLATASGQVGSPAFLVAALVGGTLALAAAIVIDVLPRVRAGRRGSRP